jgi:hypothetical protein
LIRSHTNIVYFVTASIAPEPIPEPDAPSKRVILGDMQVEDRDRVLRLLFSKLHGTAFAAETSLPVHSFDIDPNATSSSLPSFSGTGGININDGTTISSLSAPQTPLLTGPMTTNNTTTGAPLAAIMPPVSSSTNAAPPAATTTNASSAGLTFLTDMQLNDVANRIGGR